MSSSNSSLSTALAVLSINTSDELKNESLKNLPNEVIIGIAKYLDHKSLLRGLGETCSRYQQIVLEDVNDHWKVLHDKNWHCGKLFCFDGPPSRRPRDGIVSVDDGQNWREEFIRRVELDRSLPELLSRVVNDGNSGLLTIVEEHGSDIYDSARLMARDPLLGEVAQRILVGINVAEAQNDWLRLHSEPVLSSAGYEDGLLVFSKLYQSQDDLITRKSPNEIYDEINRKLDALTPRELLTEFECIREGAVTLAQELLEASLDVIFLDKVLENQRGMMMSIACITPRVTGAPLPGVHKGEMEWWRIMKVFLLERLRVGRDERMLKQFRLLAEDGNALALIENVLFSFENV